jgi:tRNA nucleotidyltransferase/poly(A) polymerase
MEIIESVFNRIKQRLLGQRKKTHIQVPNDIILIRNAMASKGFDLYLVGGSVRDALLGKEPKDFDLATDATPDQVIATLKGQPFVTNILETGKAFGVVNVFTANDEFEIATFRSDVGSGRRPDGVNFTNINKDVKRRDLTINALFYDLKTGEIVDLVKGRKDIENGVVRTVGKPMDRFGEDRLRIMRAIRFAARFGSNLDEATDMALRNDSSLEGISPERIRDEFLKSFKSAKSITHLFGMYRQYDLLKWIFGKLNVNMAGVIEEKDPIVLIAGLLIKNNLEEVQKALNALTYSWIEVSKIVFLLRMLNFKPELVFRYKKAEIVSKIEPNELIRFAELNALDMKMIEAFVQFKLSVTGDEMLDKGIKPGPDMGRAIEHAEFDKFTRYL